MKEDMDGYEPGDETTMTSGGSVMGSERSFSTSRATSEPGQAGKWKKTIVRQPPLLDSLTDLAPCLSPASSRRQLLIYGLCVRVSQMRIFREFCAKYVDGPRTQIFEGANPLLGVAGVADSVLVGE